MSAMHLDEELVQRFLHGELTPPAATSVGEHLGACGACRSCVAEAERDERRSLDLLRHLDHVVPRVGVRAVMSRTRAPDAGWWRWAAGIVLVLAAGGAAYAAPGSPVPALVGRLIPWLDDARPRREQPAPRTEAPPASTDEVTGGISVAPGERFTIAFSSHQPRGVAVVSLTDGAEITVRAVDGAAAFTSDVDRLSVDNGGTPARFEIQIPRNARRVDVRVAGRRVFSLGPFGVLAEGGRDAEGRYLLPLSAPPA